MHTRELSLKYHAYDYGEQLETGVFLCNDLTKEQIILPLEYQLVP
jgi:hypothetical protein